MGTSMIPLTGGLLPLENLTRVTRPGSRANSACTAAALRAMTALLAVSGLSSQLWNGRLENLEYILTVNIKDFYFYGNDLKADRPKIPKCIVLKDRVCFPSLNEMP